MHLFQRRNASSNTGQLTHERRMSICVHGNAVMPERAGAGVTRLVQGYSSSDLLGVRSGWGAQYSGEPDGTIENWFQFVIPTLASVDDTPMYLDNISVLLSTSDPDTGLVAVDLWDGHVAVPWHLPSADDKPTIRNEYTHEGRKTEPVVQRFVPRVQNRRWRMRSGLNVSLHVVFGTYSSTVLFSSVCADFSSLEQPK